MPAIIADLKNYNRQSFFRDGIAAIIVTVLLIPQSLAYAMLAGIPVQMGLYASILPLVFYALLGSSRNLSVGPVAVLSLLSASAIGSVVEQGLASVAVTATTLALLSGLFLLVLGVMRVGFMVNFLSHSVISGFITASALLIAASQMKHILGIESHGETLQSLIASLIHNASQIHLNTMIFGIAVLVCLMLVRQYLSRFLLLVGVRGSAVNVLVRSAPVWVVAISIGISFYFQWPQQNIAVVAEIPSGLPSLVFTLPSWSLVQALWVPALMLSIIGYVESVSVGKTLGAKKHQSIDANQELVGLGAANIAASISGGYPVTGGFSRSVVNFDAGAQTQMASLFTALGMTLALLFLTPVLFYLPKATLAATIIVAVFSLIDLSIFKKTWRCCKGDFTAVVLTVVVTLLAGVEVGVISGVLSSLMLFLYRSATPHIAEVGLVAGTEYFRNTQRHKVEIDDTILMVRIDESLFFANAEVIKETVEKSVYKRPQLQHVVLVFSAVNRVDFSALEILEGVMHFLRENHIQLHLAEVKGPVMDGLKNTEFLTSLNGKVFFTPYQAFNELRQLSPKLSA